MNCTKTYKYEELFEELNDGSGDVLMIIPEEIRKLGGFNEGDSLTISVNDNKLYIEKQNVEI